MISRLPAAVAFAAASIAALPSLAAVVGETDSSVVVGLDQERNIDGVGVACTGVGQTKADPHWLTYSVRLEFSNPSQEYLADEAAAVFDASGHRLAAVSCEGPWILFKLPPGAYRALGWLPGAANRPVGANFRAPAKGQLRLVLRFPGQ
ncbi:MAG TPA: hypothetical protein VII63_03240 [Caulobacteraceae bacterium]